MARQPAPKGPIEPRRKGILMTLEEALKIVNERYGLQNAYVQDGTMFYVVRAEAELSAMRAVKLPKCGIALTAPEVVDLARGATTIQELVRKKNPELFP